MDDLLFICVGPRESALLIAACRQAARLADDIEEFVLAGEYRRLEAHIDSTMTNLELGNFPGSLIQDN